MADPNQMLPHPFPTAADLRTLFACISTAADIIRNDTSPKPAAAVCLREISRHSTALGNEISRMENAHTDDLKTLIDKARAIVRT